MATLYVTKPGARIEKHYHQLLVTHQDEILMTVPLARVSDVVLVGQVGVTTPALHSLLRHGVGLTLLSRGGGLIGRLRPPGGGHLALRQAHYARGLDAAFCLCFARSVVNGKLRNCRTLARRIARKVSVDSRPLQRLDEAIGAIGTAADLAALRGIEGSGTRAYFRILAAALPPEMPFERRTRRPPGDPINAMLSLGYVLLTTNLIAALEIVGLDPYDGFFHADKYGRPALALDLVEEFRPVIADSVVLTLVNKRIVTPGDFEPRSNGAVGLTRRGLRQFLKEYTRRVNTPIVHPAAGRALTYQKIFEVQARALRKVIEGERQDYRPFRIR